ncbi:MAG: GMC family oxidoreductase [Gammaproteobacteria bacterium]|nr:GMC family oxidoreductase [Gammaproteobacteria bacterium]MDP2347073.1 GMC family oxidoreductase [Gammaproteobacteria bacterium]
MAWTSFPTREEVDFVVVGSGAAGGIMAKELSTAGFSVVVLEQGPHLHPGDFKHDEWSYTHNEELTWGRRKGHPQTFRKYEHEEAKMVDSGVLNYAHNVGGSSAHYSGNFWRLRPIDFQEASIRGPIAGTNFADWPITYEELEPYYTKVDWEIGVSGLAGPWDPPRSRDYPCPPMPVKASGVLMERAGKALGYEPYPAPVAILSRPHNGRPACIHCGFCNGFGCEVAAKSSSAVTMIPLAEASGNCELRTGCTVSRINTNDAGRVTEVVYWEEDGTEQAQMAKAVVLCANGAETPRLLFLSESSRFPDGLGNSSGMVGKNLMFNGSSNAAGLFPEPVNAHKSIPTTRVIHDFYTIDPSLGFYGGGGIDCRSLTRGLPMAAAMRGGTFSGSSWGSDFKKDLMMEFTHTASFNGHCTTLPLSTNNVTLDPTVKDKWGRPALRTTFMNHPDDLATMKFFMERSLELMDAAGAIKKVGSYAENGQTGGVHLLGTCRMGNDPATSVVDRYNRSHDVPNLFMVDGGSMVTSGRGQPTMTIMALAFRAADHIIQAARRNEI